MIAAHFKTNGGVRSMTAPLSPAERRTQIPDGCYESGCRSVVAYRITTAAGRLTFCDVHSRWYREKGQRIYPYEILTSAPSLRRTP